MTCSPPGGSLAQAELEHSCAIFLYCLDDIYTEIQISMTTITRWASGTGGAIFGPGVDEKDTIGDDRKNE